MLKQWIKTPSPSPTIFRVEQVSTLAEIRLGMEDINISISHLAVEKLAQSSTTQSFRHEEEQLRLKFHCLWLKASDKNTAYFRRQCKIRLS